MYKIREVLGLTEIGKRSTNEDAIYPILENDEMTKELKKQVPEIENLYLVCDGVGGANKGEIASFLTTVNFPVYFSNRKPADNALTQTYLQEGVYFIEKALDTFIEQNPYAAGMACTLTLLYFNEYGANIGWAGDSRVYHIRGGEILYQTHDHSYVNELVKMGQITEEEAPFHRQKNVILRAIQGSAHPTVIETHSIPWSDIKTDDIFMLCTDGVTETFTNEKISITFETHRSNSQLLETIHHNCFDHSRDNYSCYLVEIGEKITIAESTTAIFPPIEKTQVQPVSESNTPQVETISEVSVTPSEEEAPILMVPVDHEFITPENHAEDAEKIASMLDQIQANLPNLPQDEDHMPLVEPTAEPPHINPNPPHEQTIPPYNPPPPPPSSKGFPIWAFVVGIIVILLLVCGVLWYYMDGPGAEHTQFNNYYKNAQAKVKLCESNGRCLDAKGAVNQAKDAAQTPEEFKKVEALMTVVTKKEDEIKQKEKLLSPEPMDKGKTEPVTTPKSVTPTPKTTATSPTTTPATKETKPAETKTAPATTTTTTTTTTTSKPTDTKTTTPPKIDTKTPTTPPKSETKPTTPPGIKETPPTPPTKPVAPEK